MGGIKVGVAFVHLNIAVSRLFISLQTVPLQSIVHELDKCFILCKGTVWRGITDIQERDVSNIPMCYLGNVLYYSTEIP